MWILLQTVIVEDSGFNEIWAGIFALIGGLIAVGGSILSTRLISRHERNLERDSELRRWRMEQLQPTLTRATQALVDFSRWDDDNYKVFMTGTEVDLEIFTRQILTQTHPMRDLGHVIVVARDSPGDIGDRMTDYFEAYGECVKDITASLDRNLVARTLGLRWRTIMPKRTHLVQMMDSVIDLIHETEIYAFGETGDLTLRELEAVLAAYDESQNRKNLQS